MPQRLKPVWQCHFTARLKAVPSQDFVLGYSRSSLTGTGFWVETRFPGLRPELLSVVPNGTGFWVETRFPGLRPGLLSVVPNGTGFWVETRFPGLRPGMTRGVGWLRSEWLRDGNVETPGPSSHTDSKARELQR